MDNQHKLIKGYRDLSEEEIRAMNEVKAQGEALGTLVDKLKANASLDQRWVEIAQDHLQQGIMAAVRSIAQPTTF
jgi:hypothetical protein